MVFAQYSGAIDKIEVRNPITDNLSKVGYGYNNWTNHNWEVEGCVDDEVYITLFNQGNFYLHSGTDWIQTEINGSKKNVESNGSNLLVLKVSDVKSGYAYLKDYNNSSFSEYIGFKSTEKDIVRIKWQVGYNDTLAICEKTPYAIPTSILNSSVNGTKESFIGPHFFYKINNAYSKQLDVRKLKNGDIIKVCRLKGSDDYSLPDCSKEGSDTIFSQNVVVKIVNKVSNFYAQIAGYKEICPGDTILLSVFYSQCVGYYVKNGEDYPTKIWTQPNTQSYSPYKQAQITTPGIYNMYEANICGPYEYNCPTTTDDLVVIEKQNCKDYRIFGTVYFDENKNGKYETNELTYSGVKVKITDPIEDTVIGYGYSDDKGMYSYASNVSFKNGVKISILDPFKSFESTLTNVSSFAKINLSTSKLKNNVKIELNTGRNRPGFEIPIYLTIKNLDSITIDKYSLKLNLDKLYTNIVYTSKTPDTQNNNVLIWELESLEPGEIKTLEVYAKLNTTAIPGKNVLSSLFFYPIPLNSDTSDNKVVSVQLITSSLDPNEKLLSTNSPYPENVLDTTILDYKIYFQNMGTDTAFTVIVKDKLSSFLDFGSFKMLEASHKYSLKLEEDTLIWTFNKILLPDNKVNEPGSHGHVHFQIKPKAKTPQGFKILNKADIYFDYNLPVETNATSCTFGEPVITENEDEFNAFESISFYPNPTNGKFTIVTTKTGTLEISDLSGNTMYVVLVTAPRQMVDVSNFKVGSYFCRFVSGDKVFYNKLLKLE